MKYKIAFVLILVVAIFSRFYKLGSIPSGLTWDEAAIGYNAYGLITNHRDEWLKRTPIVFQSFGDFKSPLLIYVTTLPVAIFGLTPFAIRLPIALAGTGLVIVSFFLAKEVTKKLPFPFFPYFAMFLVAISPWAIHYSRMGFESMLAAFLISLGALSWLKGQSAPWWLIIGDMSFALSLYAYHSAKIVMPLIAVMLCILHFKLFLQHKKQLIIGTGFAILTLIPLGYATLFGKANARALSTTVIGQSDAVVQFIRNYGSHLSPAFLLQGEDITYRHSTMEVGVLYPIELLLLAIGIVAICLEKDFRKFWWIPTCFFIGLIPASLGLDAPHSNRALLALPWAQLTAGIGIVALTMRLKTKSWKLMIPVVFVSIFFFGQYARVYSRVYISTPALRELGYGYDEVMGYIRPLEGEVERVYFTNTYGQAYVYILIHKKLTPMEYQHGGLANYTIASNPWKEAEGKEKVLVVGTADEIPADSNVVKEILFPDGQVAFRISRK